MLTSDQVLALEQPLRLTAFVSLLLILAAAERIFPRRGDARLAPRQGVNIALMVLNTALLRVLFPVLAVGFAAYVQSHGIGVLPWLALPVWASVLLAVLLLDMAIYWQHRGMHWLPVLWRMHRVHHSDLAFDLSLGVRFHPLEIALSMLLKFAAIAALGASPLAVLCFELALSAGSLFTHADLRLPARFERVLRWLLVTPDMHRIHHSIHRDETNSNFGFSLSLWDRCFGSYRAEPRDGHAEMQIGLAEFRQPGEQSLLRLLRNPFRARGD